MLQASTPREANTRAHAQDAYYQINPIVKDQCAFSLPRGEPWILRLSLTADNCKFRTFCCAERCTCPRPASSFLCSRPASVNCKSGSVFCFAACSENSRSVACERRNHRHFWPPRKFQFGDFASFFENCKKAWKNKPSGAGRT